MGYLTHKHAVILISECQYQVQLLAERNHGWCSRVSFNCRVCNYSLRIFFNQEIQTQFISSDFRVQTISGDFYWSCCIFRQQPISSSSWLDSSSRFFFTLCCSFLSCCKTHSSVYHYHHVLV